MMPFDFSKFKYSTLLVLTAATLIVACESNSETPASPLPPKLLITLLLIMFLSKRLLVIPLPQSALMTL